MREQLGKLLSLGSGIALNMKLGIDLIHILLDAALRKKQSFRYLTDRKPLCHLERSARIPYSFQWLGQHRTKLVRKIRRQIFRQIV